MNLLNVTMLQCCNVTFLRGQHLTQKMPKYGRRTAENRTSQYISDVLRLMGREPDDWRLAPIDTRPGRLQLATMVAAMTCIECGCPPQAVPVDSLNKGFLLVGMGDPGLTKEWWR